VLGTPPVSGRADKTRAPLAAPPAQTAPAIVQDDGEALRRSLLGRLEFEELNLSLAGVVATGQGKYSCFIKHLATSKQVSYNIGEVIGGYRIAAITSQQVTFDREGTQFFLTLGESSGNNQPESALDEYNDRKPDTAVAEGASGDVDASDQVVIKLASADLKKKTKKFSTAKLIENASNLFSGKKRSSLAAERMLADGASVRFITPVAHCEISSPFGYRRHPLGGGWRNHNGVDLAAPYGTNIYAAAGGVVTKVRTSFGYGRHVVVRHANGFETLYGHLSRQLVSEGDTVAQGDLIGREGSTGNSTGPHLHFEIHKNGMVVDPEGFIHPRR